MPDISMCLNEKCIKKEKCFRFKATPNYIQSYSEFIPEDNNYECFLLYTENIDILQNKDK